jgi:hypothetical protein
MNKKLETLFLSRMGSHEALLQSHRNRVLYYIVDI